MMNTQRLLTTLGLTSKEITAYMTLLEHGPLPMTQLARLSGEKRPTLYNMIESLRSKGFVILLRRNHKTLYDAEKPKKLLTLLHARETELQQLLPELERIRNTQQTTPNVEVYEGEEAAKNAYDEAYQNFSTKEETCFISAFGDLEKHLPYAIDSYFPHVRKNKNYKVRALFMEDESMKRAMKRISEEKVPTPTRFLSSSFPVHNDLILQKEKVYLFSFHHRIFTTVIQDAAIAQTMKSLFECAWEQGRNGAF